MCGMSKESILTSLPYKVVKESRIDVSGYDAVLFVSDSEPGASGPDVVKTSLKKSYSLDKSIWKNGVVTEVALPSQRLVYVPVIIHEDYDDVRIFKEAGRKASQRAVEAGAERLLLVLPTNKNYTHCRLVTLLGALEAVYVNLQYREHNSAAYPKVKQFGVYSEKDVTSLVNLAVSLELGRCVACDIGGADPERMTPAAVERYVKSSFANSSIEISTIADNIQFEKSFPLFAAVNRAASVIERHRGRIVTLEYTPSESPEVTLFLVGKGVTYDTGGADIKAGGVMAGMSRDKCGAAAVAGFLKVISLLNPPKLKVVGVLSLVRNSVGENSYVSDEMIVSRSGARIRIGNTDAEGRMIMADPLCLVKERALESHNPHLITIATLTGHAYLTVGKGYSIILDNGVARKEKHAQTLAEYSEKIGDPFEISVIRREDYEFHKGKAPGEDIMQANNQPSSKTPRGHQGPAAFLVMASGLDKHGLGSEKPIKYSHIDIAGSAGEVPEDATGSPMLTLFATYLSEYFNGVSDQ